MTPESCCLGKQKGHRAWGPAAYQLCDLEHRLGCSEPPLLDRKGVVLTQPWGRAGGLSETLQVDVREAAKVFYVKVLFPAESRRAWRLGGAGGYSSVVEEWSA